MGCSQGTLQQREGGREAECPAGPSPSAGPVPGPCSPGTFPAPLLFQALSLFAKLSPEVQYPPCQDQCKELLALATRKQQHKLDF